MLIPQTRQRMFPPELLANAILLTGSLDDDSAARVRLLDCRIERVKSRSATSRVMVEFAGPATDQRIRCAQEGPACPGGDLRLAALATFEALSQLTGGALTFDLIGVKPVRAFDTTVMLVAAISRHEDIRTRIVGVAIVDDDQLASTARATLHAANRLVTGILSRNPKAD